MVDNPIDVTQNSSSENDAPADSSPANAVAADSTPADVKASPSEEIAPEKEFADTIERLEEGKSPSEAVKKSEVATEAKDEPPKETHKENALSQEQEAELNKNFVERSEWKKVLSATPKDKQGEVRAAMRTIYERENALNKTIEQQKPVLQTFERLKVATGGEQYVESTVDLIEKWQKGDPKALEMLDILRNDLLQRTGNVLTSPDLVQRNRDIDSELQQGTLDENQAQQRRNDLLEIEKARVTAKRSEADVKKREEHERNTTVESQHRALVTAANDWEKSKMASDPDYPALREAIEGRTAVLRDQHPSVKEGKMLTPVEAVKVLDDALAWAKAQVAKWQPKPRARNGLNGNGNSSSATSRRQPANAEEEFSQKIEELEARRGIR